MNTSPPAAQRAAAPSSEGLPPGPTDEAAPPAAGLAAGTPGTPIFIPEAELVERFVRSSGPGGQNVNKVATAVELRFDVAGSPSLPEPVRARLLARRDRRLTVEGVLVISAQRFRTQDRNREDARARLATFIAAGAEAPAPRIASKPSRASKQRRLDAKHHRGTVKRHRSGKDWE